jgi:hypothetical protein
MVIWVSFNVSLLVTGHRQFCLPWPWSVHSLSVLFFLLASFHLVARIARADELALSPVGGFYLSVVTLLTSMKLIIALLVQEVKRYVVISLILFRKLLICKDNFQENSVLFVSSMTFFSLIYATVSRLCAPC